MCVTVDLAAATYQGQLVRRWWLPLAATSMGLSLAVNLIVSAAMIGRIYRVYGQTKQFQTSVDVSARGGSLSWTAWILLESAVLLSVAQLIYLVLYQIQSPAFALISGPIAIIYVGKFNRAPRDDF